MYCEKMQKSQRACIPADLLLCAAHASCVGPGARLATRSSGRFGSDLTHGEQLAREPRNCTEYPCEVIAGSGLCCWFSVWLIGRDVQHCSYLDEQKEYFLDIVKISKLLDEMARDARAEALRIETARLEAHRLLLRRKAELAELDGSQKRKKTKTGIPGLQADPLPSRAWKAHKRFRQPLQGRGLAEGRNLVAKDHREQRSVRVQTAIVVNETHLPELGHEVADSRPSSSDHFGESLLAHLWDNSLRL